MELHVFDFDGTIFHSPAPSARIKEAQGKNLYAKLMRPLQDNGLGWFQSTSTLMPPAVPKNPPIDEWYVAPVLQRLMDLKQRQSASIVTNSSEGVKVCVLSGRDEKFRKRIEELLARAGILDMMSAVMLKPHETYGTVKFKLEALYSLIAKNSPNHVYYYEDRLEQGQKILDGIRLLSHALHPNAPESFYVYSSLLEENGELSPLVRDDPDEEGGPCSAALRWWEEVKRRVSPDPLSSIAPFTFSLLLVDPKLSSRSEGLLSESVESDLVQQLRYERESYELSNPREKKSGNSRYHGTNLVRR